MQEASEASRRGFSLRGRRLRGRSLGATLCLKLGKSALVKRTIARLNRLKRTRNFKRLQQSGNHSTTIGKREMIGLINNHNQGDDLRTYINCMAHHQSMHEIFPIVCQLSVPLDRQQCNTRPRELTNL
jgi:hypothetical protein